MALPLEYTPLPDVHSIRLMSFQGSSEESISCSLDVYKLQDCPTYNALSYTWGPAIQPAGANSTANESDERRGIICDGQLLQVPKNLYEALPQLRKTLSDSRCIHLWIDAICIDQGNSDERSTQVDIMSDIYRQAVTIYVWLGSDTAGVTEVLWATTELLPRLEKLVANRGWLSLTHRKELHKELTSFFPGFSSSLLRFLEFVSSRRWFQRLWVVQANQELRAVVFITIADFYCCLEEVANAGVVTVMCGSYDISWTDLARLEYILAHTYFSYGKERTDRHRSLPTVFMQETRDLVGAATLPGKRASSHTSTMSTLDYAAPYWADAPSKAPYIILAFLLLTLSSRQCADPRDHVYAVFPLIRSLFPGEIRGILVTDYTLSVTETYVRVTSLILNSTPILLGLTPNELHNSDDRIELPSWVPLYGSAQGRRPITWSDQKAHFDASMCRKNTTPQFPHSVAGRLLTIYGFPFEEVVECRTDGIIGRDFWELAKVKQYLELCRHLACSSPAGDSPLETLWKTLLWDTNEDHTRPADPSLKASLRATFLYCLGRQLSHDMAEGRRRGENPRHILAELHTYLDNWDHCQDKDKYLPTVQEVLDFASTPVHESMDSHSGHKYLLEQTTLFEHLTRSRGGGGRHLFRTSKGLLGMASRMTEPGDEVWCIMTSTVPLILRPVKREQSEAGSTAQRAGKADDLEQYYEYVGEAYLQGFMNGEMLDDRWGLKDNIHAIHII